MKQTILFVDDDVNLLQGLQRLLRKMRSDWDMTFVDNPRKALELLESQPFDVVVSDMRMPDLDGAALLSEVEKKHPGTMRVILSGYAEEKSLFRSVGPAHQYLSKPCDPDSIMALMERSLKLRGILNDSRLRNLAASLRNLPSPPDLFLRVTEAMGRDEVSTSDIADIIAKDVAMTAELLKVTNSSYFSLSARVTTVFQAVRLLGMETVRNLVLHACIFRQYSGRPELAAYIPALSRHGLATGTLAQRLARSYGMEDAVVSQVQCAGMLTSIGALVLLDQYGEAYATLAAACAETELEDRERAEYGASHAELGAYLLGLWGFADVVVEAVMYQLQPSSCPAVQPSVLTYVHLARSYGPCLPLTKPCAQRGDGADKAYLNRLGVAVPSSDLLNIPGEGAI